MLDAVDSRTPLERTRWFAARAGSRAGTSAARFRAALADTYNVPGAKDLSQRVIGVALEALRPHLRRRRDDDERTHVIALDRDGAPISVQLLTEGRPLTDRPVGSIARVRRFHAPWAFLGIRLAGVDPDQAGALRLAAVTGNSASPTTVDASGFVASERLMVGVITSGGDYQATVSAAAMVRQWEELGPTLDPASPRGLGRVKRLDIHPSNGDVLVAGAAGGGVWRTDDGGDHWRPLMDGERSLTIGAVAFAPSDHLRRLRRGCPPVRSRVAWPRNLPEPRWRQHLARPDRGPEHPVLRDCRALLGRADRLRGRERGPLQDDERWPHLA